VGADPMYGMKLARNLEHAGLGGVQQEVRCPVFVSGTPSADFLRLSLEALREEFIANGRMSKTELVDASDALEKPGSRGLAPLMSAAWGIADSPA
jgi:hypothetical protein